MKSRYELIEPDEVASPALLFYPKLIQSNIQEAVRIAQGSDRLRPHVKTHKTAPIVQMQLAAGVTKHKCATIAEAEMLAQCQVPDVLIAYPLVGPNIRRLLQLIQKYPVTRFSTLVDSAKIASTLAESCATHGIEIRILIDVNVGQDRTGIALTDVPNLAQVILGLSSLKLQGLHVYDGHQNMESRADREAAIRSTMTRVLELRRGLQSDGHAIEQLVCGGTPGFPIYAEMTDIPGLECAPGTYVLQDYGYGSKYTDLSPIVPAAVLLTRVISRPTANRVTFDLGSKAVASDPPAGKRVHLLDFPPHTPVAHNEEHYVVETAHADRYQPGDVVYALPGHVCPTVALHHSALCIVDGQVRDRWVITARDRSIGI